MSPEEATEPEPAVNVCYETLILEWPVAAG
jgi:hypothetical protein